MKTFFKILSCVAVIFLVLGIVIFGIGYAMGGRGFKMDKDFELVRGDDYYEYENMELDEFSAVDINIYNGKVEFKKSENGKYGVSAVLFGKSKDHNIEVKDGTLIVKEGDDSEGFINFNLGALTVNYHVCVYVPESLDSVKVTNSNGSINIKEIDAGKTKLNTSNGSINVEGTFSSFDAKTSNGSIKANVTGGDTKLKTSNGSISVTTSAPESDYGVEAKTSNGSIVVDGNKKGTDYKSSNKGKYDMSLETSNGSITVVMGK